MWNLLVGFFLPPALAIIMQPGWSDRLKSVLAFAACLIAGTGVAYFQGDLTGKRFATAALVVLVTAMSTYKGFWKPTTIAPTIETATSP